jgi:hypothetical protein
MGNILNELTSKYPFYSGFVSLLFGISYLVYKIYKKESFSMKDYNVAGWGALVNSWALILLFIIIGLFLIFK